MRSLTLRLLGFAYRLLKRTPLIHIPLAKRMYYRIYSWSRPQELTEIDVEGVQLWIEPSDQGIASFLLTSGSYEPFEVSVVQRLLRPGDCFIDVGAHIGYYTVIAARAVGPGGRVYAFEPAPRNFELLVRNVDVNIYQDRVTASCCAIGAESGSCRLYLNEDNQGDHRILANGHQRRSAIDVPLQTLDESIDEGVAVNLIKMDIQGAEFLALSGMSRLLSENADLAIALEFWPEGITQSGFQPAAVLDLARRQQFDVHLIDEPKQRLRMLSEKEIMDHCHITGECNLLLVRGRCARQVMELQKTNGASG
jgi:FkbM family methyltransferase